MGTFIVVSLLATVGLLVAAVVILFFKEGFIEINPMRAVVVKNIWTGIPRALKAGAHQIIPGWEKRLVEITLENESSDPQILKVVTADGVEIGVDCVIYTQKVKDDDESIVKVATKINYGQRKQLITERMKVRLQEAFADVYVEKFFSKEDNEKNSQILKQAEKIVNDALVLDVEKEWGVEVNIRIQNIDLPEKLMEATEEMATAAKEGEKIKVKAEKAGVPTYMMVIGDIAYDIARALKGGK
ncbi:SPFH domain-containing protein [Candidatus Wolfebacteria bacterium]|nr:SPFH domain-containing protein [Candidatus Wolfebacteria bacterium]